MDHLENNGNDVRVIMPEETGNVEAHIVINMAEIMRQYQLAMKDSMEHGIRLGKEMSRSGNNPMANCIPQIQSGSSESQKPKFIGIADKFSYGAYTNPDSFENAQAYYHAPTSEVSYFSSFDEALEWAYNACSRKNPDKNIPLNYKRNWRHLIKTSEMEGED